jgi:hypothetical protein
VIVPLTSAPTVKDPPQIDGLSEPHANLRQVVLSILSISVTAQIGVDPALSIGQ